LGANLRHHVATLIIDILILVGAKRLIHPLMPMITKIPKHFSGKKLKSKHHNSLQKANEFDIYSNFVQGAYIWTTALFWAKMDDIYFVGKKLDDM